jgi:hypothetical protein
MEISGTCEVKVELEDNAAPEESSWPEIRVAALKASQDCKAGHGFKHTGGTVTVGPHRAIKVSLLRALRPPSISNATAAVES